MSASSSSALIARQPKQSAKLLSVISVVSRTGSHIYPRRDKFIYCPEHLLLIIKAGVSSAKKK